MRTVPCLWNTSYPYFVLTSDLFHWNEKIGAESTTDYRLGFSSCLSSCIVFPALINHNNSTIGESVRCDMNRLYLRTAERVELLFISKPESSRLFAIGKRAFCSRMTTTTTTLFGVLRRVSWDLSAGRENRSAVFSHFHLSIPDGKILFPAEMKMILLTDCFFVPVRSWKIVPLSF